MLKYWWGMYESAIGREREGLKNETFRSYSGKIINIIMKILNYIPSPSKVNSLKQNIIRK